MKSLRRQTKCVLITAYAENMLTAEVFSGMLLPTTSGQKPAMLHMQACMCEDDGL